MSEGYDMQMVAKRVAEAMSHGGTFVDVGASNGFVSLAALEAGAERVLCIEPYSQNAEALKARLSFSPHADKFVLWQMAAWRRSGEMLHLIKMSNPLQGGVMWSFPEVPDAEYEAIPSVCLVDIVERSGPILCMKVDIEGAEYEFLADEPEINEALKSVEILELELHEFNMDGLRHLSGPRYDANALRRSLERRGFTGRWTDTEIGTYTVSARRVA